ncbi:MAG: endonuclease V [Bacteroidota bacterium]|nr:endonuclease V [Bacteroidota bacterium]
MIVATDVYYKDSIAFASGVLFRSWSDEYPFEEKQSHLTNVKSYIPGQFYIRELPCILSLLKTLNSLPDIIIIDGNVWLGKEKKPGLGKYLFDSLKEHCAVIGVAKSPFGIMPEQAKVYRAKSHRPLYVTSIGIDEEEAKNNIQQMYGQGRIPYMLKRADQLSREASKTSI